MPYLSLSILVPIVAGLLVLDPLRLGPRLIPALGAGAFLGTDGIDTMDDLRPEYSRMKGNRNDGTSHPTSTVYYAPGSKPEAQEVAKELAVSDVKPATDAVLANGGSVPVIVVIGADFGQ